MRRYRSQLEQEVRNLQRQLQEEIDMHLALTDAIAHDAELILKSSTKLPNKAQELVDSISSLEITISKLETDLSDLRYQLCHVRTERLLVESNPECLLSTPSTSKCTWDEHTSALRDFKLEEYESVQSMEEYRYPELEERHDVEKESENREKVSTSGQLEEHQDVTLNIFLEEHQDEEMQEPSSTEKDGKEYLGIDALSFNESDPKKHGMNGNMCNNPNQLSGEMVRCMRDIFLHLSRSSKISPKLCSDNSSSSAGCLSGSTFTSVSDSSLMASVLRSPSVDSDHDDDIINEVGNFDPYSVNGKEARRDIGKYCSVAEVSWMNVCKEQLEYASDALQKFRSLVEQLSKVDPTRMNCDERLAFWINLYNALIMHAYLAYGVPANDIKLFSLMQKACYKVGGQSLSAAEIEFMILKMKNPAHRPQIVLSVPHLSISFLCHTSNDSSYGFSSFSVFDVSPSQVQGHRGAREVFGRRHGAPGVVCTEQRDVLLTCCEDFLGRERSAAAARVDEGLHPGVGRDQRQGEADGPGAAAELRQGHGGGLAAGRLDLPAADAGPGRGGAGHHVVAQAAAPRLPQLHRRPVRLHVPVPLPARRPALGRRRSISAMERDQE
uniref:DUF547 domain-containing protein n=1 Tax=Aegilops tauschii subsp. strangulata TaxID=200361 RepID=A0A453SS40_AEGTS